MSLYAKIPAWCGRMVSPQYSQRQLSNDESPTGSSGTSLVIETMDKIWSVSRCSESGVDYGVYCRGLLVTDLQ